MKILIIGATSRTGRLLVDQASARGHQVTLFCRSASRVPEAQRALPTFTGDARSEADLGPALRGQDAVVCILQADDTGPTRLVSDAMLALCPAMRAAEVGRVVLLSARPVLAATPAWIMTLLWLWLRNAYRDLARAEGVLEGSGLDWRIARPGRLTDGPAKGRYETEEDPLDSTRARDLSRADLATALLDLTEAEAPAHRAIGLGGAG